MPETAIFDHYEVLTRDDGSLFELGRGGMGITYKAFDTNLRMTVALKVINATYLKSEVAQQRFVREARSAAKLRNRHVASVFHLATKGDTWFYAMEFIDGETLGAMVKRMGPLSPALALKITAQVARALNAAAHHGLVHRDIKPENLMLVEDDDELVAKVIDFGLAKASVSTDGEGAMLSMGGFVGTAHFASPEQWEEREIDSRSDIYSLGITLWYMLTGRPPFSGSMPLVMSQHLTTPPPYAQLKGSPAAVADVLRKMLAKDPADRFQTPAELRKTIEAALVQLSSASASQALSADAIELVEAEPELEFTTLIAESSMRSGMGSFETNSTIANRYQVMQSCGETNTGHVFRAYDTQRKCEVRLIVLHPEALGNTMTLTAIERVVEQLVAIQHRNLLGVFAFETVDRGSFLVLEWTEGFTLLDLLKARRVLKADEALKLLTQAAEGVDHALSCGLTGLDFSLHQVQIHFSQTIGKENLLSTPLSAWPEFALKLFPFGGIRDIASWQTWVGEQTLVGGAQFSTGDEDERVEYIRALAAVTYELLGGTLSPLVLRNGGPTARYTPIATLTEEGNEVLCRALDRARSFPSAREFIAALAEPDGMRARRHKPTPIPVAPANKEVPPPSLAAVVPAIERTPSLPAISRAPRKAKRPTVVIFGAVAITLGVGAGIFMFLNPLDDKTGPAVENPSGADLSTKASDSKSGAIVPENTPATNSEPSTPAPATPLPTTPLPAPTRQEMLLAACNAAEQLEEKGDWAKSIASWLQVAKDYPEFGVGKDRLAKLLDRLRARPSPITFEEFQGVRQQITDSAQMGILSAMLLLGDNLRKPEPKEAFAWYSKAAAKGNPTADTVLGFMLAEGRGVEQPDPAKAFEHFQSAADKGDVGGKFALGECYRDGVGVAKDPKHAVEFLREAADGGDTRAIYELGDCYLHGEGVEKNVEAAFKLFTKASEKGNLNATGNLGVLYINGDGVAANPQKAVELFLKGAQAKGAQAGADVCMLLYARCLDEGIGVARNEQEASRWYRKAAEAGNKTALEWCTKHAISP